MALTQVSKLRLSQNVLEANNPASATTNNEAIHVNTESHLFPKKFTFVGTHVVILYTQIFVVIFLSV